MRRRGRGERPGARPGRRSRERPAAVDRVLPGLAVLRAYRRGWWRPDLVAGATVGAMLVPQSMAYAELAGMPPEYGFYAVIGPLVVYALVGSSRHLGVGPEPGTAILAATGVGAIAAGSAERYVVLMAALALVVAAVAVAGAALRLGFIASALSKPVLVGYITGVGLTLLSSQISAFTGVSIEGDRFFPRFLELLTELGTVDPATLAVGVASLALVLVLRARAPTVPGALAAVGLATLVIWLAPGLGVPVVGAVPEGLPTPRLPAVGLADLAALLPVAAGIVLVGFTDNVLTARSIAARQGYRIEPNQELLALGLTNLTAGLSQGFPVSSSASRTAVPASLGSRTQVVSLVAATLVVGTLLVLGPVLAEIPRAALAAVIVSAAIAIIDVPGYRSLWRVSRQEALLAVVAALGVIVFDVLVGVLVALGLSVLVALGRIARPHDAVLGDQPDLDGWVEVEAYPEATTEPGLLVYRFDAPLFFLNADRFRSRVTEALEDNPGREEWLVLDFEGIGALDATALDSLAELVELLDSLGVERVGVARANEDVVRRLERAHLLAPEGPFVSWPTINAAVRAFRGRHASPEGASAASGRGVRPERTPDPSRTSLATHPPREDPPMPDIPATMRQLRSLVTDEGQLRLSLPTVETPTPGDGEVLVRVEAAPINPSDLALLLAFAADVTRAADDPSADEPTTVAPVPAAAMRALAARVGRSMVVGNEGAGTVVAAGDAPEAQALLGRRVGFFGGATYGEYCTATPQSCLPLPDGATAAEGASSLVNPLTAQGMVETMRREGHTGLVHTAAASNLGQMLNRLCLVDGVPLVNIVRRAEQADLLREQGAEHVCDSSAETFRDDLVAALRATGATLAFDAVGGGRLAGDILNAMEAAIVTPDAPYTNYGSDVHKQVYVYGSLDPRPIELQRRFGFAWGIGGWLLMPFLARSSREDLARMNQRVADELTTTFASHYTDEISLEQVIDPATMQRYAQRATGEKFLVLPQR